jgi:hypothetical protein
MSTKRVSHLERNLFISVLAVVVLLELILAAFG